VGHKILVVQRQDQKRSTSQPATKNTEMLQRNLCGWDKKAYIAYKMVTAAPKSLLGLQDKSEKLIARIKLKHPISHNP